MKKTKVANSLAHRFHKHRGDTHDLAARLAPLEELLSQDAEEQTTPTDGSAVVSQENGAIVVGRHGPTLPNEAIEVPHRKPFLEPVVIVIVGLMLAFIVFIAWQISQMPANRITN
jgi:hypothetical protein